MTSMRQHEGLADECGVDACGMIENLPNERRMVDRAVFRKARPVGTVSTSFNGRERETQEGQTHPTDC